MNKDRQEVPVFRMEDLETLSRDDIKRITAEIKAKMEAKRMQKYVQQVSGTPKAEGIFFIADQLEIKSPPVLPLVQFDLDQPSV